MVVSELRGEKIDIIPFNDEPARFVAKALSPARVREVLVDDDAKQATVIVPDDQLSLAIGREGQNARLAARLTGWRVDIRSETEFAAEEAEHGYEEEEVAGRCAAILSNGRRCPNAALPGSRYCGLETHQALAQIEGDNIEDLETEGSEAEAVTETASATALAEAPQNGAEEHVEVVDVAEVSAPLVETEAAVIAPDPEETGAEAEAEVAEKLEEDEAGAGPEEALAEASEDAAEESPT
jgi:N utilization substance protein A